ncbi:MAG: hypothetical protein QG592_460 [Pseudomonadota bacterium]|nr:hypothetical protein [Pseudomonadota bacterium]
MSNVRTRDYDGPRSLDPACAPDEVDMVPAWRCGGDGAVWKKSDGDACPECGSDTLDLWEIDLLTEMEVPA